MRSQTNYEKERKTNKLISQSDRVKGSRVKLIYAYKTQDAYMVPIDQNHNGCPWQLNINELFYAAVITDRVKD